MLEGPSKGPPNAVVRIVEFADFQGPFDRRVIPTIQRIETEYGSDIRLIFHHNPSPAHPDAMLAAEAAVAAGAQGKFWEMHDKLFANPTALKRSDLEKYAEAVGLDLGKFKAALDIGSGKSRVKDDLAMGLHAGVAGTPTFFINSRKIQGAMGFEVFKDAIGSEIASLRPKQQPQTGSDGNAEMQAPGAVPAPIVRDRTIADAAKVDRKIFGIAIGEPLRLPSCPRKPGLLHDSTVIDRASIRVACRTATAQQGDSKVNIIFALGKLPSSPW